MRLNRNTPRSIVLASFIATLTVAMISCSNDAPPPPATDAAEASASRDGASLVVTADQTTIRTVDRLTLTVRSFAPEGMVVREIVIDPEAAGWTVIDREIPRTALDASAQVVRTDRLTIEPFLDGEYAIPPVLARFAVPGAPASIDLLTPPITITVESVLLKDDVAEALTPPSGPINPPRPEPSKRSSWLIVGSAAVVGGAIVVILIVRRSRVRLDASPDPEAELRLLLAHPINDPVESRDRLASILRRARESHASSQLQEMLDRLDTERYAPAGRRPTGPIADDINAALQALQTNQVGGIA